MYPWPAALYVDRGGLKGLAPPHLAVHSFFFLIYFNLFQISICLFISFCLSKNDLIFSFCCDLLATTNVRIFGSLDHVLAVDLVPGEALNGFVSRPLVFLASKLTTVSCLIILFCTYEWACKGKGHN